MNCLLFWFSTNLELRNGSFAAGHTNVAVRPRRLEGVVPCDSAVVPGFRRGPFASSGRDGMTVARRSVHRCDGRAILVQVALRHDQPAQRAIGSAGNTRSNSLATNRRKSSRLWSGAGGAASPARRIPSRKKNRARVASLSAAPASSFVSVERRNDRRVAGGPASRSHRALMMDATQAEVVGAL